MTIWIRDRNSGSEIELEGRAQPGDLLMNHSSRVGDLRLEGVCIALGSERGDVMHVLWYDGHISALAGAGLGLMVLRLFQGEIENIENMPPGEIYKPHAAEPMSSCPSPTGISQPASPASALAQSLIAVR